MKDYGFLKYCQLEISKVGGWFRWLRMHIFFVVSLFGQWVLYKVARVESACAFVENTVSSTGYRVGSKLKYLF